MVFIISAFRQTSLPFPLTVEVLCWSAMGSFGCEFLFLNSSFTFDLRTAAEIQLQTAYLSLEIIGGYFCMPILAGTFTFLNYRHTCKACPDER
jgi:hypothetical protein